MAKPYVPKVFDVAVMISKWADTVSKEPKTRQEWILDRHKDGLIIQESLLDQAMSMADLKSSIFASPEDKLLSLVDRVRALENIVNKLVEATNSKLV